jgi:cytochrome P450 family 142 subfamily A polypeptide 1
MPDHPTHPDIRLLDGYFYASDPHRHFDWMRENAPVYYDESGDPPVWAVTLHEDVMAISKDARTFSNAQGMRPDSPAIPSMINMDDPLHKRRRNLVNTGLTARRVAALEPKTREICADLIDRALEKEVFDFVRDVAAPLPMIMIGDMLGVEPEDRDDLLRWSDDLMEALSSTATPEAAMKALKAFEEYKAFNERVVAERRRTPRDDLISVLVHAEIDGEKLDDEALLQESLLILIGGDETTRHVISGGMYQLMRNPEQRRKLIDDPAKRPTAIEEMLRWVSPIMNMSRTLTRDVELRGQKLHEGDRLLLMYAAANRDAKAFADPHVFDVERTPNHHVAFGGYGTHHCMGANLARLELRVMFEELLRRAPELELASEEPPAVRPANFVVGLEKMLVRVAGS